MNHFFIHSPCFNAAQRWFSESMNFRQRALPIWQLAVYYENESGDELGGAKKGNIMRRTVCAFTVSTLICAAMYETSHAAPVAPLTGIQAGPGNITLVYSHHSRHSHQSIVVPLTRHYGYWWPQGQYHRSSFGLERWGYWCEGVGAHRLSC